MPDGTRYKCYEGHVERGISSELRIACPLLLVLEHGGEGTFCQGDEDFLRYRKQLP